MYDSLKRLLRTRNPEQSTLGSLTLSDPISGNSAWSIGYQYDSNGNLTQKTDARGVVSTYVYDALNRNTTVDHSDTASINPDVKRFYDGATNGKGRFGIAIREEISQLEAMWTTRPLIVMTHLADLSYSGSCTS